MKFRLETRRVGRVEHALAMNLKDSALSESAQQGLAHHRGVDAGRGCQREAFCNRFERHGADQLVTCFGNLSGAGVADPGDAFSSTRSTGSTRSKAAAAAW